MNRDQWKKGAPKETGWYWIAWGVGAMYSRTVEFYDHDAREFVGPADHRVPASKAHSHVGPLPAPMDLRWKEAR